MGHPVTQTDPDNSWHRADALDEGNDRQCEGAFGRLLDGPIQHQNRRSGENESPSAYVHAFPHADHIPETDLCTYKT